AKQAGQATHAKQANQVGGSAEELLATWELSKSGEADLPFECARILRNLPIAKPETLRDVLARWCSQPYINPERLWYEFIDAWFRVGCPAGLDAFEVARRNAEERTLSFVTTKGSKYDLVGSFAHYVQAYSKDLGTNRILLPVACLANWLGIS